VALVNVEDSPLARMAHTVLPLHAGAERSVAATKSYLASLAAILQLGASWKGEPPLLDALDALPDALRAAWRCDWSPLVDGLQEARNLFVLGRGLGLAAAQEAALKFKETCGLHAEAFSSAEVKHGPMALVGPGFPVLAFALADETGAGTRALAEEFRERGAPVWIATNDTGGSGSSPVQALPLADAPHPACAPLLVVQSFYRAINALALRRGFNPDLPPHLNKVTETV
jgi:glucosamine--fructose-6-phosphate aminotransferase (isomerizing)